MSPTTPLTWIEPGFAALPQISPADLPALAAQGVRMVINNRPDGESPGQPAAADIAAAAQAAGLAHAAIPITAPTLEAVEATRAALASAPGPVVAFCRSGNRSATLWACARALDGADPAQLIDAARRAGFDLSGLAPLLASLAARAGRPQPG